MKQTEILTEEAKELINKLCNDVDTAKGKIKEALDNDLGVKYHIDAHSLKYDKIDFSEQLNTIPFYLEMIKNCYALMEAITGKCLIGKTTEDLIFKPEAKSMPSQAVVQSKSCDKSESEIKIGDRVKLKGDSNSPEMTVTRNVSEDTKAQMGVSSIIGKGVEQQIKSAVYDDGLFECSYFIDQEDMEHIKNLHQYTFHKDALEKIMPHKEPVVKTDIKVGDVVEMENDRFMVSDITNTGVQLSKTMLFRMESPSKNLTNYRDMPFKKVETNPNKQ